MGTPYSPIMPPVQEPSAGALVSELGQKITGGLQTAVTGLSQQHQLDKLREEMTRNKDYVEQVYQGLQTKYGDPSSPDYDQSGEFLRKFDPPDFYKKDPMKYTLHVAQVESQILAAKQKQQKKQVLAGGLEAVSEPFAAEKPPATGPEMFKTLLQDPRYLAAAKQLEPITKIIPKAFPPTPKVSTVNMVYKGLQAKGAASKALNGKDLVKMSGVLLNKMTIAQRQYDALKLRATNAQLKNPLSETEEVTFAKLEKTVKALAMRGKVYDRALELIQDSLGPNGEETMTGLQAMQQARQELKAAGTPILPSLTSDIPDVDAITGAGAPAAPPGVPGPGQPSDVLKYFID